MNPQDQRASISSVQQERVRPVGHVRWGNTSICRDVSTRTISTQPLSTQSSTTSHGSQWNDMPSPGSDASNASQSQTSTEQSRPFNGESPRSSW